MMSTSEGSGPSDMTVALRVIRFSVYVLGFRVLGSGLGFRDQSWC